MGLLADILKYYPIQWDHSEAHYADQRFVSELTAAIKAAYPFTKRSYRISLSETEAEKLSDAIFEYGWEDEAWRARPREERTALVDLEERIGKLLEQFKR